MRARMASPMSAADPSNRCPPSSVHDGRPAFANAFALSPCDATMKKNLVEALSAYAKAWSDMAGCKFFVCGGDDRKIDTAATNFSTPSDMRVREAVRTAFEKGGISREDFPGSIRLWVTMLAGDPGDPESACSTKRAERRR